MKHILKILVLVVGIATTICSCNAEDDIIENAPSQISLIAPNGEQIMEDMEDLNQMISRTIATNYGDDYNFKIESIEYTDIDDGYLALITYSLEDGTMSNFALSNSIKVFNASNVTSVEIETDTYEIIGDEENSITVGNSRSNQDSKGIKFFCKSASSCIPCQVKIGKLPITEDNKDTEVECTSNCPDCKLKVVIPD
ncbi:MAG: hypothetical protein IKK07_03575 [Bacteroides sp.]|nr:hypothetical protein [Bacteroides sp.]